MEKLPFILIKKVNLELTKKYCRNTDKITKGLISSVKHALSLLFKNVSSLIDLVFRFDLTKSHGTRKTFTNIYIANVLASAYPEQLN